MGYPGNSDEAYAEALNKALIFQGVSKKAWLSPNKRLKARIGFLHELRAIKFFVVICDKKGNEVKRKPLGETVPEMGVVPWIMRQKGEWKAHNVFRLEIENVYFHVAKKWEVELSDCTR